MTTQTADTFRPSAADPRVPPGFRRLAATVWVDELGRVVVEADPDAAHGTPRAGDDHHNCDAMGCGQCHVVLRARLPGPDRALIALGARALNELAERCLADMGPVVGGDPTPDELEETAAAWRRLADIAEAVAHTMREGG